jgi:hypothetical protein
LVVLGMEQPTTSTKDMVQVVEALDPLRLLEGMVVVVLLVLHMDQDILEVQVVVVAPRAGLLVALEVQVVVVAPQADLLVALATTWASHNKDPGDAALTFTPGYSMSRSLSRQNINTMAWKVVWHGGRRSATT